MTTGERSGRALPAAAGLFRRGLPLALVWAILTGGDPEGLLLGAAVVPASLWLSLRLWPSGPPLRLRPLVSILPGFVRQSVIGGVDVARRALHPALPVNPGWVEIPVSLPDGAVAALGAELSLMPGTLAAGSDHGRLLIHLLDRDQDVAAAVRREEARFALMTGHAVLRDGTPR